MSFTIHRHLDSSSYRKCLPPRFRELIRNRDIVSGDIAMIVFSDKSIILSSHVRKALDGLEDLTEPNRIAVGHNFTREGFEYFDALGFRACLEDGSVWTDDELKRIRRSMNVTA
jgi:hypothetical protein